MNLPGKSLYLHLIVLSALVLSACATTTVPEQTTEPQRTLAYVVTGQDDLSTRYAPLVIPENPQYAYNRIGTASARYNEQGREEIFIDTASPVFYFQQREFHINQSRYINLVYRMHFEKVPYPHLTAGKNGGLLVIVTLNEARQPLLITTVHTCGCYLAFFPTSFMPDSAFPDNWDKAEQQVFGIALPGLVRYPPAVSDHHKMVITIKQATHRVSGISVQDMRHLGDDYEIMPAAMAPIAQLKQLPLDGTTTSFYHEAGADRGYVKNAFKPFEFLLMSWWVFDARVGVDKEYGPPEETGTVFYTSLRPWKRKASDMWAFADFLRFWGWRLE